MSGTLAAGYDGNALAIRGRTRYNRSMGAFEVRPALVRDAEAVAALHVRSWRAAYAGIMPDQVLRDLDPQERAARLRQRYADPLPRTYQLVAVETGSGAVAGLADAGPYHYDQSWDELDPVIGEVYAIYTDPRWWDHGVGRLLMDAAVTALRADQRHPIHVWVLTANHRARRFYERYGFTTDGTTSTISFDGAPDLAEVRYTLAG
jgi:GNAT superfamily N-acetyltransferase